METENQTRKILRYMQEGNTITPIEALAMFGCFRLSARIWDLRNEGEDIETERICRNGKWFAGYKLKDINTKGV